MREKKVWLVTGGQTFEAKASTLLAQAQAHRELSASLAFDDA
jgi:hypothetical protein